MFLRSYTRLPLLLACLITVVALPFLNACKGSPESTEPSAPWVHTSEATRYELTIPPSWTREDQPKKINSFADLAVNLDNSLFLIVIPQKLPTFPVPDARALKTAGMEVMQKTITDMQLKRQGDIVLDSVSGASIFFEGTVETERIQYIATYITNAGWGYQIIAWGSLAAERRLIEEVDQILAGWKFLDREHLQPVDSSPPIAEADLNAPSEQQAQILNSLENTLEHPDSSDSLLNDSDQDDEQNENNIDSDDLVHPLGDNFSEGN